ncbi:unnamed protein product [Linum trigynum]|uniref:Uncharacterized protein n=1 Tax=Linum trigynum TaxID=586398 RepID=A0AAV2E932_9ROSI
MAFKLASYKLLCQFPHTDHATNCIPCEEQSLPTCPDCSHFFLSIYPSSLLPWWLTGGEEKRNTETDSLGTKEKRKLGGVEAGWEGECFGN